MTVLVTDLSLSLSQQRDFVAFSLPALIQNGILLYFIFSACPAEREVRAALGAPGEGVLGCQAPPQGQLPVGLGWLRDSHRNIPCQLPSGKPDLEQTCFGQQNSSLEQRSQPAPPAGMGIALCFRQAQTPRSQAWGLRL